MKPWIFLFCLALPLLRWHDIVNNYHVTNLSQDVSKSIQKAMAYLHSEECGMDYSVYAVYHYLERLYKIQSLKSDTFFISALIENADSIHYKRLSPFFCLTRSMECRYDTNLYEKNSLDNY